MITTKATRVTYTSRGFEYEQTADGGYRIYKDGKTIVTQPSQAAVHAWIAEEKRKEHAALVKERRP